MKRALGSIAFTFPVLLLGIVYVGDSHRQPLHTTPVFFGLLLAWAFACRFLGLGADEPAARGDRNGFWASGSLAWWIRSAAVLAGFLIFVLMSERAYQGMRLFPRQTTEIKVALGVAIALLAPLVIRPPRASVSLGLLALAGVLVRACGLWQWEIDPARRDMLALIVSALDAFTSGENPYGFHQMQVGSAVPLTYPPGLWLGHLPAYALGLDVRWTGVAADGVAALAIGGIAVRRGARTIGPALAALAAYLFLPDVHWNGIYAEPNLDWAVLALLCAAVLSRRPLALGVIMGLALTTRPFNLVLLPFLAVWMLREHGTRVTLRTMLVAALVASALYVPFVAADPDAFYVGTVRWLLEYGPAHNKWFWGMLGVAGQLYKHGHQGWLLPLQLGSVGALLAVAAWRLRTARGLLSFWAVAYALFVAFNSIIWMSFWIGVGVIAAAGTVAAGLPPRETGGPAPGRFSSARGRWPLAAEIAASMLAVSCAGFLALQLARHFSDEGRDEVRAALVSRARPGDMILDRAGWRVAFLKMPYVLERGELPRGAIMASTPFTEVSPARRVVSPTGRARVWVVERYGLFEEDRAVFLGVGGGGDGPFRVAEDAPVGRYRLLLLERAAAAGSGALSEAVERLSVEAVTPKGKVPARWRDGAWVFPGAAGWQRVQVQEARFDRIAGRMIWAHPWPNSRLILAAPVEGTPSHVTLVGGLRDKAPQWRRADVRVTVSFDGARVGERTFPNRSGLRGASFPVPPGAGRMELEISASDVARRNFLLDVYGL